MAFGQGFFTDRQRRNLIALSIALISLSFIPFMPQVLNDFLTWEIGGSQFTVGSIFGIVGLYAAWLLLPGNRRL